MFAVFAMVTGVAGVARAEPALVPVGVPFPSLAKRPLR